MNDQLSPINAPRPASAVVLVVEDDEDERSIVREVLEDEGYTVEETGDGGAALARVLGGPPPDVILLDLLMPGMDGWHLVAELRARQALADIPVVVMTGAGDHVLMSAPVSAGYLAKPLSRARLLETLAATVERARRRDSGPYPPGE